MAKRSTTSRRALLRSTSRAANVHNIADFGAGLYVCTSCRRASADGAVRSPSAFASASMGDAARSSSASASVSAHNCYVSGGLKGGSSAQLWKRPQKVLSLAFSARLAGVHCLLSPILVCSCIAVAEVVTAAPPATENPLFFSSLPVVRSRTSPVSSALASTRASAFGLPQGVILTNEHLTPTNPFHFQRDFSVAAEYLSNVELRYRRTDIPYEQSNSPNSGKITSFPPTFSSDGDGTPGASSPIYFVVGLLLSVTGTLISAVGDICIRYSFVRQKGKNCAPAAAVSIAEAANHEVSGAPARADVQSTFALGAARDFRASSGNYSNVDSYSHSSFTASQSAVTEGSRDCMWTDGTSSANVSCEQYGFSWKSEDSLQQAGYSITPKLQQSVYCRSMSAVATPSFRDFSFPPLLYGNQQPSTWTEHVQSCAADVTCKAIADSAATTVSFNSTHSPVSTTSSVNTVSPCENISTCCWSSVAAVAGGETCRTTGFVEAPDSRITPERACQPNTLFQTLNSRTPAVTAAHVGSEASPRNQGVDAVRVNVSMSRPIAAPVGTERKSCEHFRWDGFWMLGTTCTCVVSPLLSIISLSLLPANVTGFAALQILFVVLLARYFLGELIHRVNLGGGVLVIAGLVTLTWSTKSISSLPDRAALYGQLISPQAVVFELSCGCIILSGLLLLLLTPELDQQKNEKENIAVQGPTAAAVEEETVTLVTGLEARHAVLSLQREQQQRQHQDAKAGPLLSQDRRSAVAEAYACTPASPPGLHSLRMGAVKVKKSVSPSPASSEDCARFRWLESRSVRRVDKTQRRTAMGSAVISDKAKTADDEAEHFLQTDAACITSLCIADSAEVIGERSYPSDRPGRQGTSWYLYILCQSRNILLPMAAGVSGSIATICLKLVQAFVVSFSAACHNVYNNRSLEASRAASAVLHTPILPVSDFLPGISFPAIFPPLAASFLAGGSSSDLQFPGQTHITPAPDTPSPSAAPAISVPATAATPTAQSAAPQATFAETESVSHLLLCLISPTFLAAHLQLPLLLGVAAAAALIELLFLSHTLKNQPASEGVPLMNATLTISMGLGGLTLLGAAPDSAVGWSLGLGLLVVGVGILGFGGKTWLATRRFVLHILGVAEAENEPSPILTQGSAAANQLAFVSNDNFPSNPLAGDSSIDRSSEDTTSVRKSDIGESVATTAEARRIGLAAVEEAHDVLSMLRTLSELAAAKSATWETDTPAVGTATIGAWPSEAKGRSKSVIGVEEKGGTDFGGTSQPGNSGQHRTEQETSLCEPIEILPGICGTRGAAGAKGRSRGQELRSPLLSHSE